MRMCTGGPGSVVIQTNNFDTSPAAIPGRLYRLAASHALPVGSVFLSPSRASIPAAICVLLPVYLCRRSALFAAAAHPLHENRHSHTTTISCTRAVPWLRPAAADSHQWPAHHRHCKAAIPLSCCPSCSFFRRLPHTLPPVLIAPVIFARTPFKVACSVVCGIPVFMVYLVPLARPGIAYKSKCNQPVY